MVKVGLIPNIVLVGLVMMITVTYWETVLDLTGDQPEWAVSGAQDNVTDLCRVT
jgi:hypothetical protein